MFTVEKKFYFANKCRVEVCIIIMKTIEILLNEIFC